MTNPMTTKELAALAEALIEAEKGHYWGPVVRARGDFIAACTPEAILALTARVEALSAALNDIQARVSSGYFADAIHLGTIARAALNAKEIK